MLASVVLFGQMVRARRVILVPLYAADILGLDVEMIGYIVSIPAVIDLSLFFPAGLIMDRLGRKYASVPYFTLQGLGMMLVPLASSVSGLISAAILLLTLLETFKKHPRPAEVV